MLFSRLIYCPNVMDKLLQNLFPTDMAVSGKKLGVPTYAEMFTNKLNAFSDILTKPSHLLDSQI